MDGKGRENSRRIHSLIYIFGCLGWHGENPCVAGSHMGTMGEAEMQSEAMCKEAELRYLTIGVFQCLNPQSITLCTEEINSQIK